MFYGILESMVELGTLELSIHNSLPRELITAIGKLKYIDLGPKQQICIQKKRRKQAYWKEREKVI